MNNGEGFHWIIFQIFKDVDLLQRNLPLPTHFHGIIQPILHPLVVNATLKMVNRYMTMATVATVKTGTIETNNNNNNDNISNGNVMMVMMMMMMMMMIME